MVIHANPLRDDWSGSSLAERGFAIMTGIHGQNPIILEMWDVRTERRFGLRVSSADAVASIRDHLAYIMCDPVSFAFHNDRAGLAADAPWQETQILDYISDVQLAPLSTWPVSYHTSDYTNWVRILSDTKKTGGNPKPVGD